MESKWVDFRIIKQAVSIQQVLNHYGINLKSRGKELRGKCPLHKGEGQDTFHANRDKNAFHCFSCGAKGNVLDLVAALEKCSVREAALKLQQWFDVLCDHGAEQLTSAPSGSSPPAQQPTTEAGERA